MLPPLASFEELAARLGFTPTGAEADRANALLEDASALVRDEAGIEWVDDEEPPALVDDIPDRVVSITLAVAQRAFENPEALTQITLGDLNRSYDRSGVQGAVYLTDAERNAIRRVAGGRSGFVAATLASPYGGTAAVDDITGN